MFRSAAKHIVWGNDFRDADGTVTDYGIQMYGTLGAEICHNYFYGQYNQVVSFKEGNRDYTIAYNTIQGGQGGAGIFLGQNDNTNALGWDTGLIRVHHNHVSRAVNASGGNLYRAKDPYRVGYLRNADVRFDSNVAVGTHQDGFFVYGNGTGTVRLTNNAVAAKANGTVFTSVSACILRTGTGYTITSDGLKCYDAPTSAAVASRSRTRPPARKIRPCCPANTTVRPGPVTARRA